MAASTSLLDIDDLDWTDVGGSDGGSFLLQLQSHSQVRIRVDSAAIQAFDIDGFVMGGDDVSSLALNDLAEGSIVRAKSRKGVAKLLVIAT
ncbi:hypothetical protein G3A39_39315 [Paraburkholderia aspalathi]|nr:hypothetical protein [Paraburkholderia aspalathi]